MTRESSPEIFPWLLWLALNFSVGCLEVSGSMFTGLKGKENDRVHNDVSIKIMKANYVPSLLSTEAPVCFKRK